jgi:hypothetical protein
MTKTAGSAEASETKSINSQKPAITSEITENLAQTVANGVTLSASSQAAP